MLHEQAQNTQKQSEKFKKEILKSSKKVLFINSVILLCLDEK